MKNVWWLVAGAVAFIAYKMYDAASNLTYFFTSVTLDKSNTNLFTSTLDVTLRVKNPNNQGLTFDRFVGSLSNNGTQIALIDIGGPGKSVTIAANTETDITFPVQVSNFSVLAQILDLVVNRNQVNVSITGTISIGSLQLPISQVLPVTSRTGIGNVPKESTKLYYGLFGLKY